MNAKRLLTLATFLRSIPDNKFDLQYWRVTEVNLPYEGVRRQSATDEELRSTDCNTSACAIGWACSIPEFQELGFHWGIGVPCYTGERGIRGHANGWYAVKRFFGLDTAQAKHLFAKISYAGYAEGYTEGTEGTEGTEKTKPAEVAQRIEELVGSIAYY